MLGNKIKSIERIMEGVILRDRCLNDKCIIMFSNTQFFAINQFKSLCYQDIIIYYSFNFFKLQSSHIIIE